VVEAAAALIHEDARIMGKTIADQFREEGYKKGNAEGVAQGEVAGRMELLLRLVRKRFGDVSPTIEDRIRSADGDTLDRWAERILTANRIDEVFA
jgi:flagellar biosynthesis/type III secretory pathway protein FliH